MAAVQLSGIFKRYGETQVVHGIDLDIDDGEFVVLVGPSGCGKSTLMRMVAGLEEISGGELMIGGQRRSSAISRWCSRVTRCIRIYRSTRTSRSARAFARKHRRASGRASTPPRR